jgi:Uma2 family endonuclease
MGALPPKPPAEGSAMGALPPNPRLKAPRWGPQRRLSPTGALLRTPRAPTARAGALGARAESCYPGDMNQAALKIASVATLEDFLAIPEEKRRRYELIEGVIVERGAASGEHGGVQFALSAVMAPFQRRPGGRSPGGWWFATEVDVYFDEAHTFRPDVAGWRRARSPERPQGTPVTLRPDWICEILSTNRRNDSVKKMRAYHRHAVPHYWIVDPVEESLSVSRWTPEGYMESLTAERGERVLPEPFEAIPLLVGVLFGDEEED